MKKLLFLLSFLVCFVGCSKGGDENSPSFPDINGLWGKTESNHYRFVKVDGDLVVFFNLQQINSGAWQASSIKMEVKGRTEDALDLRVYDSDCDVYIGQEFTFFYKRDGDVLRLGNRYYELIPESNDDDSPAVVVTYGCHVFNLKDLIPSTAN